MTEEVGERLRRVRQRHGLSQRALAKRAGVTNGLISLIEQSRVSPSIASLKKVLDGIPISLADFFTDELEASQRIFYSTESLPDLGKPGISYRLVGYDRQQRQMSILKECYLPGSDTGEDMLVHEGEEGGVIVSGKLEVTVGEEVKLLGPGDAYYFESRIPHRFRNLGNEPCELVTANSPPTF